MVEDNNKKDIEVVQGIGNLDISPVYGNLKSVKPKMQDEKPKNIVVPEVKKPKEKEEESEVNEESEVLEETLDNLADSIEEENSEESEKEQIEFEDIDFEDVDLDDDIDEADKND